MYPRPYQLVEILVPRNDDGLQASLTSLKGEGLDLSKVSLAGPDGPVAFTAKEGKGKVTIFPVVLEAGTGTYAIRFPESLTVTARWSVKPGRVRGTVSE